MLFLNILNYARPSSLTLKEMDGYHWVSFIAFLHCPESCCVLTVLCIYPELCKQIMTEIGCYLLKNMKTLRMALFVTDI